MTFTFDNTYARLPARFFASISPTKVRAPRVVKINRALAEELGLEPDELASPAGAQVLSGNVVAPGAEPIALAYAGHQFGSFVRQLGDGRAILLGEVVAKDGRRVDIQLK
ncbi:MAG: protein adenylyltransferase SelO family protein, partial [Polyangiaceae bacterium]